MINAGTKPDHNRSRSVYLESTHLLRAGWLLIFILLVGLQIAGLPYRYQEALAAPKTSFSSTLDDPAIVTQALTGILFAFYYSSVILFQQILRVLTGQAGQSSLAIVVSTLGVAALFNPLRRRIQEFIDRRFYRSRYDAEQTLVACAAGLQHEVELDAISQNLLAVTRKAMQPESVKL